MIDALVVGSGPNGLAAAVTLARAGLGVRVIEAETTVGGGARTLPIGWRVKGESRRIEYIDGVRNGGGAEPLLHDVCSAVHPLALASPFFRAFDLRGRGVELRAPEIAYAQPLDADPRSGLSAKSPRAGLAYRDIARTAEHLGADGAAWLRLLGPLSEAWEQVAAVALGDRRTVRAPYGPGSGQGPARQFAEALRMVLPAARFGLGLLEQGSPVWGRRFSGDVAPALLTGVAAHVMTRVPSLSAAGTALLLGALAHAPGGWALPVGGSQVIVDALVADFLLHGGHIETGRPVRTRADLPAARTYIFDTAPRVVAEVFGGALKPRARAALQGFPHGNGAAKVDFVVSGPVPWAVPDVGRAATVHLGGSRSEMGAAESTVAGGRHAERPVTLLSDPTVTDPNREVAGLRPLWAYAHVPRGSTEDVTEVVTAQVERFAPGFRDTVVQARCIPAAYMADHNANYVGGDIGAGTATLGRMLGLPAPTGLVVDPYEAGTSGVYLCSASVPPGPGVHGMGGWHVARRVLAREFGISDPPDLSPPRP